MFQHQQGHLAVGVGVEQQVAAENGLAQVRRAQRGGKLPCPQGQHLPLHRSGVQKARRPVAGRRTGQSLHDILQFQRQGLLLR